MTGRHDKTIGSKSQAQTGFTLVEVLVVMAVITVLLAILFPVFSSARRHAQQVACLSNLRELGQAVFMYAQDYDDLYPYGGDPSDLDTSSWEDFENGKYWPTIQQWHTNDQYVYNVMASYVKDKELWHCPSDDGYTLCGSFEDIPLDAGSSSYKAFGTSYGYTTLLALDHQTISGVRGWSRQAPYSEQDPVDIPLLWDMVGEWHGGSGLIEGRLNMVMVDGHAINVSRNRANVLNQIVFTIPTPAQ